MPKHEPWQVRAVVQLGAVLESARRDMYLAYRLLHGAHGSRIVYPVTFPVSVEAERP
jgi:hypothetical protein